MTTFTCKTPGCNVVENRFGSACSCFNHCRRHHTKNGNKCHDYFKPSTNICSRVGCYDTVCKKSKGKIMQHCGMTCFKLDSQPKCKFASGCGSNTTCAKPKPNGRFSH